MAYGIAPHQRQRRRKTVHDSANKRGANTMEILTQTDSVMVTESLQAAIEQKIGRVLQYAPRALRARVWLRRAHAHSSARQYSVRVLYELPGCDLSAAQSGPDVGSALDLVAEKIERRLRRRKTKCLARRMRPARQACPE
jgi:putative sigma-54 modulation protein